MLISAEYIRWLERLPCNRHARRRQQKHGQWLDGWVPDVDQKSALIDSSGQFFRQNSF